VCDDFEWKQKTRDCDLYTPNGYTDQWTKQISGKPGQSSETCPENVIIGIPPSNLVSYLPFLIDRCYKSISFGILENLRSVLVIISMIL